MIDMWGFLVEGVFGSYIITILALALIFFIILVIGNVSLFTNLIYNGYFIAVMSMGYSTFWAAMVFIGVTLFFIYQLLSYLQQGGGAT